MNLDQFEEWKNGGNTKQVTSSFLSIENENAKSFPPTLQSRAANSIQASASEPKITSSKNSNTSKFCSRNSDFMDISVKLFSFKKPSRLGSRYLEETRESSLNGSISLSGNNDSSQYPVEPLVFTGQNENPRVPKRGFAFWNNISDKVKVLKQHEACFIRRGNVCGNEECPVYETKLHRISTRRAFCRSVHLVCVASSTFLRAKKILKNALRLSVSKSGSQFPDSDSNSFLTSLAPTLIPVGKSDPNQTSLSNKLARISPRFEDVIPMHKIAPSAKSSLHSFFGGSALFESYLSPQVVSANLAAKSPQGEADNFSTTTCFFLQDLPFRNISNASLSIKDDILIKKNDDVCIPGIDDWSFLSDKSIDSRNLEPYTDEFRASVEFHRGENDSISIPGIDDWSFLSDASVEESKSICIPGIDDWRFLSDEDTDNTEVPQNDFNTTHATSLEPASPESCQGNIETKEQRQIGVMNNRIFPDTRVKFLSQLEPIVEESYVPRKFPRKSKRSARIFHDTRIEYVCPLETIKEDDAEVCDESATTDANNFSDTTDTIKLSEQKTIVPKKRARKLPGNISMEFEDEYKKYESLPKEERTMILLECGFGPLHQYY